MIRRRLERDHDRAALTRAHRRARSSGFGPYLMPRWKNSTAGALLDVDFTAFSQGFLTNTSLHSQSYTAPTKSDLVFEKKYSETVGTTHSVSNGGTYGETVQTSPSTLIYSGASTQTDIARVGNRTSTASKTGLVIEHVRFNYIGSGSAAFPYTRKVQNTSNWGAPGGGFTSTYPFADSPDTVSNTGCTDITITPTNDFNGYSPYAQPRGSNNITARVTVSSWFKDVAGGLCITWWPTTASLQDNNSDGIVDVWNGSIDVITPANTGWARVVQSNGGTGRANWFLVEGRNVSGFGGPGRANRHARVDFVQFEFGDFPSESIVTPYGGAPGDRLKYLTGSALVAANGQIKLYARFSPKFSTAMQVPFDFGGTLFADLTTFTAQTDWYVFSYGGAGASYAKFSDSDKKLRVKLQGGTEYVSTNAISFAQYDEVELELFVGNNVASVAKYRINGGSWVDLVLATVPDAPAPGAAPIRFWSNDAAYLSLDEGYFPQWLHHLTVYR